MFILRIFVDFPFICRILVQRFGPETDPLRIPDDIYRDSIGFFIAKFVKIAD